MKKEISSIRIEYTNGEYMQVYYNDLQHIKALGEAMKWIERAKNVYEDLKPLFNK